MINKIVPYLIIVLLVIAMYLGYTQIAALKEDNARLAHNFEQSLNDNNQLLYMTKKEMREYYQDTLLKTLMDSLDIKYKHIVSTHKETYIHKYDTTIKMLQINDTVWDFNHKFDPCVSVKGRVSTVDYSISFDDLSIDYASTTLLYWKRPNKFWFIPYGKKKYFIQNINNCSGETEVKEVQIVK